MTKKTNGSFCWVELLTPNIDESKAFYQDILGWESYNNPMPQGGNYYRMKAGDYEVAGAFQLTDDMKAQGISPQWSAYVLVDDVDATTKQAKALGASVYNEPFDIMDIGRMAVLADPTGAPFCLWQTKTEAGLLAPKDTVGSVGWCELMTSDTKKAAEFYTQLFGWDSMTQEMQSRDNKPGKIYTTFINKNVPVGGMFAIPDDRKEIPSHWGIYFSVTNIDDVINKAKSKGATPVCDTLSVDGVGRFTTIRDPQNVHFSLIEFAGQQ